MNNKKEFTKDELYEHMKYIVYCMETEKGFKDWESHISYQDFLKDTDKHFGDCTKESCPCQRCFLIGIEIDAQNIIDTLFSKDIGYCGKKCISECDFKEEKEETCKNIPELTPPDVEDSNETDVGPEEEEKEYFWEHKGLETIMKATRILIEKYPKEFKKIVKDI